MQVPLTLAKSGARPNYLVHHEMLILYDFCWFWFLLHLFWMIAHIAPTESCFGELKPPTRCGQILPGARLWKFGSYGLVRTSFLYLRKAGFWSCRRTYHSGFGLGLRMTTMRILKRLPLLKWIHHWDQVVAIATSSLIAAAAPPGTACSLWRWLAVRRGAANGSLSLPENSCTCRFAPNLYNRTCLNPLKN